MAKRTNLKVQNFVEKTKRGANVVHHTDTITLDTRWHAKDVPNSSSIKDDESICLDKFNERFSIWIKCTIHVVSCRDPSSASIDLLFEFVAAVSETAWCESVFKRPSPCIQIPE